MLLYRNSTSQPHDDSFNYQSVIGKLNYLERGTRTEILFITHQCARFTMDPKVEHAKALLWLGRYMKGTQDKGLILRPSNTRELEVFVDADFSGKWDKNKTWDCDTARYRHGYIVSYHGCPIIWKSQMQTEIALSSN